MEQCIKCQQIFCQEFGPDDKCPCWNGPICGECVPYYRECKMGGCNVAYCGDCEHDNGGNSVRFCHNCQSDYCQKCRLSEYRVKGLSQSCDGCLRLIGCELASENEDLKREIKELKQKKSSATSDYDRLLQENRELKKKLDASKAKNATLE